jgi:hypothetical protein
MADDATSAFDRETSAIREQILELEKGAEAAERFRLAKEGLGKAEIDAVIALQKKREELASQQERLNRKQESRAKAIGEQGDKLFASGLTPSETRGRERRQISDDFNAGRLSEEAAKQAVIDSQQRYIDRRKRLMAEEERLSQVLATPQEFLNKRMKEIAQLQNSGILGDDKAVRAEAAAIAEFKRMQESQKVRVSEPESVPSPTTSTRVFASSAALAFGGGASSSPVVSELKLLREEIKMRRKEANIQSRAQAKAAREGGGIALG